MQLDLQEEYLLGNHGDGALFLDSLNSDTRSVTWQQSQTLGNTHISMNAACERYSYDTPYTGRLGLTIAQPVGKVNFNLTSNWSDFDGNQNGVAELAANLPAVPLGKTKFSIAFAPFVGENLTVNTAANSQATASTSSTANTVGTDDERQYKQFPPQRLAARLSTGE